MKRVLIIGAGGMAGHVVSTYLSENPDYQVSTVSAHNKINSDTVLIDITDQVEFTKYLDQHNFDIVVNCVGMLVKASDERKDLAVYLNSFLPHMLEQRYIGTSTRIIHLSTDCVFSGKGAPYTEDSWPDGPLFYDRTKALGEIVNDKDLTFRMSIIGPDAQAKGIGLFNWYYAQTGEIDGYKTAIWNGVTTITLARAIEAAIEQNLVGLYHLVPNGNISKFDLLNLFNKIFERNDITVHPVDTISLDKTLVNTRTDFDFTIPEYPEMIAEMKNWIVSHKDLYPHYQRSLGV